ncbi:hypothetical protein MMUR_08980 [Mycolicibacterium murale]|uniref:Uncharacterized protein n=1 Tax=Mycolicibacterium murale TaxID=182220 RepID=A0A7I9WGA7_9MYCO|nr:hypothetical protein MMUR_08980 [Mycolicibacterium murale]
MIPPGLEVLHRGIEDHLAATAGGRTDPSGGGIGHAPMFPTERSFVNSEKDACEHKTDRSNV